METSLLVQGRLHSGGALGHLVSKYPDLMPVLKELIQNSIDKKSKNIFVRVDFDRREVEHLDDGEGADKSFSEKALGSIGQSTKKEDQYGRFGIGLMAPLSVCEKYTFTSTSASQHFYMTWTFERNKLFNSKDGFHFPCLVRDEIHHASRKHPKSGSRSVWWTTQVFMRGLTEDKRKNEINLEDLTHEVQSEFSKKMLELGISVTVVVKRDNVEEKKVIHGKAFQGKKLDLWVTPDTVTTGKVTVQMYLAPPGANTGQVRIIIGAKDDLFRLTWKAFSPTAGFKYLKEETRNALNSKVFQGEIVSDGIKLTATRRSFEDTEALMGLGLALDQWYEEVGSKYLADEKGKRARERYQDLGNEVIDSLSWMFKGNESIFAQVINASIYGTVGKGHAPTPKSSIVDGFSMTGTTQTPKERSERTSTETPRVPAQQHRPSHSPSVSIGPKGGERVVVRGHSMGPHILYNDFDGSSALWKFDPNSLCLQINITHPSFVAVEKSDYKIKVLSEQIFLTAFQLELQPPDFRMHAEKFAAEMLDGYVELLLKGTISRKIASK